MNSFSKTSSGFTLLLAVLILVLGAHLRLGAVAHTEIESPIRADARDYFLYAFNLKEFHTYSRSDSGITRGEAPTPDALRSPGYPVFLAPFIDKANIAASLNNILYAQALIGILTVAVFLLIYRDFLRPAYALAAATLTAISPHLINSTVYLLTECLFTLALGVVILLGRLALRERGMLYPVLAGMAIAVATLVRPTTQYLIVILVALALLDKGRTVRERLAMTLLMLLPVVLVSGAWTLRNLNSIGATSDPTLLTNFLHHGMYIDFMYEGRPDTYGYPYRFDPLSVQIGNRPIAALEEIKRRFTEKPLPYLQWYLVGKPVQFFAWDLTESVGDAFVYAPRASPYFKDRLFDITHDIAKQLHYPTTILALACAIGLLFRLRNPGPADQTPLLLAAVLLYFVAVHMVGSPFPRYSVPVRPIMYGLALLAFQWGHDCIAQRRKP